MADLSSGAPSATGSVVRWETVREGHLPIGTHTALAELLRKAFPHARSFAGRRSWSAVRPESRVIGWVEDRTVACAGVLRRFVDVEGRDQLVAIVGLVAVHPHEQGAGLGRALMGVVATALADLDVPFGLLMCAPRHVPFFERTGWHRLSPRRVCLSLDDTVGPQPFVDELVQTAMVSPVRAALADWPDGDMNWHGAAV